MPSYMGGKGEYITFNHALTNLLKQLPSVHVCACECIRVCVCVCVCMCVRVRERERMRTSAVQSEGSEGNGGGLILPSRQCHDTH